MKKYFFTPRVGKDYEKGFHGIKAEFNLQMQQNSD